MEENEHLIYYTFNINNYEIMVSKKITDSIMIEDRYICIINYVIISLKHKLIIHVF